MTHGPVHVVALRIVEGWAGVGLTRGVPLDTFINALIPLFAPLVGSGVTGACSR